MVAPSMTFPSMVAVEKMLHSYPSIGKWLFFILSI